MDQKQLLRLTEIICEKSYKEGSFTLASGQKSDYYIDLKATTLDPEGAFLIGSLTLDLLKEHKLAVEAVGGLTLGADPIATSVSLVGFLRKMHLSAFIVRKEAKSHGTSKYIEGVENLRKNSPLLILEDVVTTGASSVKAIERLRDEGFHPVAVVTVVDRQQNAEAVFSKMGIPLYSLLTIDALKKYLKKN